MIFIAQNPGRTELVTGKPFTSMGSQILCNSLTRLGIKTDKVYKDYAVACNYRNETPPQAVVAACRPRLQNILRKIADDHSGGDSPVVIVAMGALAYKMFVGDAAVSINDARGNLHRLDPIRRIWLIPTLHPASFLHGGGGFKLFERDLAHAVELVKTGIPRTPPKVNTYIHTKHIEAIKTLKRIYRETKHDDVFAADVETTGFNPRTEKILELGVAPSENIAHIFPREILDHTTFKLVFKALQRLHKRRWLWWNGKFDASFLYESGYNIPTDEDGMLCSYALNEEGGDHSLKASSREVLGADKYDAELWSYLPNKNASFELVPSEIRHKYLGKDCCYTFGVWKRYRAAVREDPDLEKLYVGTLIPASNFLQRVERVGIAVDDEKIEALKVEFTERCLGVRNALRDLCGKNDFNPNSPKQVGEIIYNKFGVRPPRGYKKNTQAETLEKLLEGRTSTRVQEFLTNMLAFRKANKMLSTYINGIRKRVGTDGRIHSTYKIHGTDTGRLSSNKPNMQNIPRKPEIRDIFRAKEGHILCEVDYSQAELRTLAHLSDDKVLKQIYQTGRDLHAEVVRDIVEPSWHKLSPTVRERGKRTIAKFLNFGIVYGRTAVSINYEFECGVPVAQTWIDGWFEKFFRAKEFLDNEVATVFQGKPLVTPFGNKRRFGLVTAKNKKEVANQAKNFKCQSTATHLTLRSAIMMRPLLSTRVEIVNLVHDSILFEIPNEPQLIEETVNLARTVMKEFAEKYLKTDFPFEADYKLGTHWGSMKEPD